MQPAPAPRRLCRAAREGNDRHDAQPFLQRFIEEFFVQIFTRERKGPSGEPLGMGRGTEEEPQSQA